MDDFRVKIGFFSHFKTQRLRRESGADAVLGFIQLWEYCASAHGPKDGNLGSLDDAEIEAIACWPGKSGEFVAALRRVRFLDDHQIHQFTEHQPWVASFAERSETARQNANTRWTQHAPGIGAGHGNRMQPACATHAEGNAPPPPPPPSPSPSPKNMQAASRHSFMGEIEQVLAHYWGIWPESGKHLTTANPKRTEHADWKLIRRELAAAVPVKDLILAIDGNKIDPWHSERGMHSLTDIFRNHDKVERFAHIARTHVEEPPPYLSSEEYMRQNYPDRYRERYGKDPTTGQTLEASNGTQAQQ